MQNFDRRRFLLACAAAGLSLRAVADIQDFGLPGRNGGQADISDAVKPYLAVGPYAEDRNRVYMFLSYECPYCEQNWYGMGEWGRTLPDPFRFVYVPIYTGNKRLDAAATGFYVVRDLAPAKIADYQRLAFEAARTARNERDFVAVLYRMGFSQEAIRTSVRKQLTQERMARAMTLAHRYRVTATPFFAVGGRYTTHAGFTGGNYQMLIQLLNGLVSNVVQSR